MSAERSIVSNPTISLYTDGSCDNVSRLGAWGYELRYGPHTKADGQPLSDTTSSRCELTAAIEGLNALTKPSTVALYTDSQYLINGAYKLHGTGWPLSKFHKANQDLWLLLASAMKRHEVDFYKVKAHAGRTEHEKVNERVDRLANEARKRHQDGSEGSGQVLDLQKACEAPRTQPEASREVQWPVESTENYLRFGREVTLLYPFVQHDKEEVPKVITPLGLGTIKQAFSDGVKVALDKPVRWLYSKSGKPSPAMEEFQIGEVWPLTNMENELEDESSDGPRLHGLRGNRTHQPERGGRGDEDKEMLPERSNGGGRGVGAEEGKVDTEPEASQSDAELTLL